MGLALLATANSMSVALVCEAAERWLSACQLKLSMRIAGKSIKCHVGIALVPNLLALDGLDGKRALKCRNPR